MPIRVSPDHKSPVLFLIDDIHEGVEKLDPNISQPDSWAENSHQNILDSQAARQESHRLREQVDSTITESANSMWRSWNESNDALRTRIAESTEAHTRLQYHLSRTKQEVYDQEKHVWALKRAIRDKEAPLKVAQTRLEARTHRPEKEACRDAPYHGLVQEVKELNNSIRQLNGKLAQAEDCHQELLKNKSKLEHDIKVKANSLFIDSEGCLSTRKNFPVVRLQPSCDVLVKQLIA
jgi:tektin-3